MLEVDAVRFEDLQEAAAETNHLVHQDLLDLDEVKIFSAGDAGHDPVVLGTSGDDTGEGAVWIVGVLDLDGNARLADRIDGLVVQNVGAHVGQFAELLVSQGLDVLGILDEPRVSHHEAVDVRPVLIELGSHGPGRHGAGNIAAAAGESLHFAARRAAVETGHDDEAVAFQLFAQPLVSLFLDQPVALDLEEFRRFDEARAEPGGDDLAAEVFAAGGHEILRRDSAHVVFGLV